MSTKPAKKQRGPDAGFEHRVWLRVLDKLEKEPNCVGDLMYLDKWLAQVKNRIVFWAKKVAEQGGSPPTSSPSEPPVPRETADGQEDTPNVAQAVELAIGHFKVKDPNKFDLKKYVCDEYHALPGPQVAPHEVWGGRMVESGW